MAALAQGLPVFFIPEQGLIAPVRDDMIHHCSGREPTFLLALHAQRMPAQKSGPLPAPLGVVASGIRAAAQPIPAPLDVFGAVDLTAFTQPWTAGIPTRALGLHRHSRSPHKTIKPRWLYTESPLFRFFMALSSAMTSATAPSTFSVDFALSSLMFPAGSVRA